MDTTLLDRKLFLDSLKLYDRPEAELHQRPLDADFDVDMAIDDVFGAMTRP